MVTTMARNSRKLLAVDWPQSGDLFGTRSLHAVPDQVNPPRPKGHASESVIRVGFRRVSEFREIPW